MLSKPSSSARWEMNWPKVAFAALSLVTIALFALHFAVDIRGPLVIIEVHGPLLVFGREDKNRDRSTLKTKLPERSVETPGKALNISPNATSGSSESSNPDPAVIGKTTTPLPEVLSTHPSNRQPPEVVVIVVQPAPSPPMQGQPPIETVPSAPTIPQHVISPPSSVSSTTSSSTGYSPPMQVRRQPIQASTYRANGLGSPSSDDSMRGLPSLRSPMCPRQPLPQMVSPPVLAAE